MDYKPIFIVEDDLLLLIVAFDDLFDNSVVPFFIVTGADPLFIQD